MVAFLIFLLPFAIAAALGYLLGSIPFGLLITRAFNLGNLREIGSGNIGATNVLRTGNRLAAALTLILDMGKAAGALWLARYIWGVEAGFVAGGAALIGHCLPVWLKFRGGKGVATFFGVMLVGLPFVGLFSALTWLVAAFVFRISSLAALIATALAPLYAYVFHAGPWGIGFALALAVFIWIRHHENIRALLRGEERRIGAPAEPQRPA
jgi:glycerol-3-phosphate acyltransferase PlsY